jgi:hypothetical protein
MLGGPRSWSGRWNRNPLPRLSPFRLLREVHMILNWKYTISDGRTVNTALWLNVSFPRWLRFIPISNYSCSRICKATTVIHEQVLLERPLRFCTVENVRNLAPFWASDGVMFRLYGVITNRRPFNNFFLDPSCEMHFPNEFNIFAQI